MPLIKFGEFQCDTWHNIRGLNDPLTQQFIKKCKKLDWDEHQLWFFGGILEDRLTKDIDGAILGPYVPNKIQYLLTNVVGIGFELGVYPDVFYMEEGALFEGMEELQRTHIYYNGIIQLPKRDKQIATLNSDGLYERVEKYPLKRSLFLKEHYSFSPTKPKRIA